MEKITWAPKIRQAKIWQLYHNDALGTVDEILVADVGGALLERCRSIVLSTRSAVECPRCGAAFAMCQPDSWRPLPGVLTCPTPGCGWETTNQHWHDSWRHRDLLGLAAIGAAETYLNDYPRARTPEDRMVCIDQLIHTFHIGLQTGKAGRSFANNLIEGSHQQVVDFLDRLSARPGGVDKDAWRAETSRMFRLRRGQEETGGPSESGGS